VKLEDDEYRARLAREGNLKSLREIARTTIWLRPQELREPQAGSILPSLQRWTKLPHDSARIRAPRTGGVRAAGRVPPNSSQRSGQ